MPKKLVHHHHGKQVLSTTSCSLTEAKDGHETKLVYIKIACQVCDSNQALSTTLYSLIETKHESKLVYIKILCKYFEL